MVVVDQVIIMALLILLGIICYKLKIIDNTVNKALSSFVLMVVNPIVVFVSYQTEFDKNLLYGLGISFALAAVCFAVSILLSSVMIKNNSEENISERFACIYSNCGFMGIPLVSGIYGNEGVLYLTSFMTVFNILVWTHGVVMMKGKMDAKLVRDVFKTPVIIATFIGLILFLCNIILPEILLKTLNYISGMNTPLAMLVAGVNIAQIKLKSSLKNIRIYYISAVRLIIIPAVCMTAFYFLPFDEKIVGTNILAASCPAAATGTLFAVKYNKNPLYASELFAMTTIVSIATLPLIMYVFEKIMQLKLGICA